MHRRLTSIPQGGGARESQLFQAGSADRGERRLIRRLIPRSIGSAPEQTRREPLEGLLSWLSRGIVLGRGFCCDFSYQLIECCSHAWLLLSFALEHYNAITDALGGIVRPILFDPRETLS